MLRYYGGGGEHINRFGSALTRNDFQTAKLNADSTEYGKNFNIIMQK